MEDSPLKNKTIMSRNRIKTESDHKNLKSSYDKDKINNNVSLLKISMDVRKIDSHLNG